MTQVRRNTLIVAALLVLLWTLAISWEWSFIDDVGLKTIVNTALEERGVAGLWEQMRERATFDREWGLFRPLYYVYTVVFYLVNPAVAHGIRLGCQASR